VQTGQNLLPPPSAMPKFIQLEIYEKLWNDAVIAFEHGEIKIDRHLPDRAGDARRGVTLLFRPPAMVRDAVTDFMGRLVTLCPGQYFYQPQELHVTVLSIISGTELWQREMDRLQKCRPLIGEALKEQHPFRIKFHGLTASPESVLIQGFPLDGGLAAIRTALRETFARAGFADMLDRRYKVTAAHITMMRFCRPGPDIKRLLPFLKENRQTGFGECEISNFELILGDWYASADKVKTLEDYKLC
jgi:2'-5' RNA ligase